jgi:flavorubredoxin
MPADIHEIAPDLFRISTFIPEIDLAFNQFLLRDEKPLLYHTGMKALFPEVRAAVAQLIDPAKLAYVSFSHFEADESGALNQWLELAPQAETVVGMIGAMVNMGDYAIRPARGLQDGETFSTGKHRLRFMATPHLPHGWDAGLLFEETRRTLFCSDLMHQNGKNAPVSNNVIEGVRNSLAAYEKTPMHSYMPFGPRTEKQIDRLIELKPQTLAIMHGASFNGDGAAALKAYKDVRASLLS